MLGERLHERSLCGNTIDKKSEDFSSGYFQPGFGYIRR